MSKAAKTTVSIPTTAGAFDISVLQNISWSLKEFNSHHEVATTLVGKQPYTITILIEHLNPKFWNRKQYVKKTKIPVMPKYKEMVNAAFDQDFGNAKAGELYRTWLEQYQPLFTKEYLQEHIDAVDEYIFEYELEPRYRQKILARSKNHAKLFQDRHRINRERYYNVPEPFQRVDWRNPYDNIFVWTENGHKVARRGGSGASGSRETNSKFILGLLELSQTQPIPSYLFVYSENNELVFVKKFDSLSVPAMDIGANYHQISADEARRLEQDGQFLHWNALEKISAVEVLKGVRYQDS